MDFLERLSGLVFRLFTIAVVIAACRVALHVLQQAAP